MMIHLLQCGNGLNEGWRGEQKKNDKEKAKDYFITPGTILELHINITVLIRDELTCLLQRKNEVRTVGGGIYGYIRTYKCIEGTRK